MPGPYFEFVTFRLQLGAQVKNLLGWIENRALPMFQKHSFGPMGFFTVEIGPAFPALLAIRTSPSLAEWEATRSKLEADPEWAAALEDLEAADPAYYRLDNELFLATPFSPPLEAGRPGDRAHKVLELRIYETPTRKQLGYLHDRFVGGEIELFHRAGIHPVFYADSVVGPNRPKMAYLIPYESEAHREEAVAAFRTNPEWQRLRAESIRRGGEIVRTITNLLIVPTSFSGIR